MRFRVAASPARLFYQRHRRRSDVFAGRFAPRQHDIDGRDADGVDDAGRRGAGRIINCPFGIDDAGPARRGDRADRTGAAAAAVVENINEATLFGLKAGVGLTIAAGQLPKLLGYAANSPSM